MTPERRPRASKPRRRKTLRLARPRAAESSGGAAQVPLDWLEVPTRVTHERLAPEELRRRKLVYVSRDKDTQERPAQLAARLGALGGRPRKVADDKVRAMLAQYPRISLRAMAKRLGVARSTLRPVYDRLKAPV
jgi:hypothetical protein